MESDVIEEAYFDGGVDEIISTRRLVHIIKNMQSLVKDESVEVCTNRFDNDTKNSFIELYTKVDQELRLRADSRTAKTK